MHRRVRRRQDRSALGRWLHRRPVRGLRPRRRNRPRRSSSRGVRWRHRRVAVAANAGPGTARRPARRTRNSPALNVLGPVVGVAVGVKSMMVGRVDSTVSPALTGSPSAADTRPLFSSTAPAAAPAPPMAILRSRARRSLAGRSAVLVVSGVSMVSVMVVLLVMAGFTVGSCERRSDVRSARRHGNVTFEVARVKAGTILFRAPPIRNSFTAGSDGVCVVESV